MPIEFRCSGCGKLLRVPDEAAGKQAQCPACGRVLPVPAFSASPTAPPPPKDDNPYRSPQYGGGPTTAREPLSSALVQIQDLIDRTWVIFKGHWVECVVACLIFFAVLSAFVLAVLFLAALSAAVFGRLIAWPVWSMVITASVFVLFGWLLSGLIQFFLRIARGQPTELGMLFNGGPQATSMALAWVAFGVMVWIGFCLLVVPGVILALMLWPSFWIIADRNAGVVESFEMARRITAGNKWTLFLTLFLVNLVGGIVVVITSGLGNLIVTPFLCLLHTVAYLQMTGQMRQ